MPSTSRNGGAQVATDVAVEDALPAGATIGAQARHSYGTRHHQSPWSWVSTESCDSGQVLPEIAISGLRVRPAATQGVLHLTWPHELPQQPCAVEYRVYVAVAPSCPASGDAYVLAGTTTSPSFEHAPEGGGVAHYLVVQSNGFKDGVLDPYYGAP